MQIFTAVIQREEDLFVAECPEIGTISQGESIEEALANLKEATELYLDEFPIIPRPERSFITTFEVAEIAKT
jgi:predicted RNase H-like HicB family nuclease